MGNAKSKSQKTSDNSPTIPRAEPLHVANKRDYPEYSPKPINPEFLDNYDGDTITVIGRVMGDPQIYRFNVRVRGIDCPELRTNDVGEKEVALLAKKRVNELLKANKFALEISGKDKYGRILAKVILSGGVDIGSILIRERLAVSYDGKTKKCPANWLEYYNGRCELHQI